MIERSRNRRFSRGFGMIFIYMIISHQLQYTSLYTTETQILQVLNVCFTSSFNLNCLLRKSQSWGLSSDAGAPDRRTASHPFSHRPEHEQQTMTHSLLCGGKMGGKLTSRPQQLCSVTFQIWLTGASAEDKPSERLSLQRHYCLQR